MLSGYPSLSVPSPLASFQPRPGGGYGFTAATGSSPPGAHCRQLLLEQSCRGGGIVGFCDCANDGHAGGTGGERVVEAAEGNAADGEARARRSLVRDVFHLTPRLFGCLADLVREIEPPAAPRPPHSTAAGSSVSESSPGRVCPGYLRQAMRSPGRAQPEPEHLHANQR